MEKLLFKCSIKKLLLSFFRLRIFWETYLDRNLDDDYYMRVWKNFVLGDVVTMYTPLKRKESWEEVKKRYKSI